MSQAYVPEKHPVWRDRCEHCGTIGDGMYILVCPECEREGCQDCMPAGRDCVCPQCEEGKTEGEL